MIALLAWYIKALAWRLVGVWERRGMRYQPVCEPPPPPPIDPYTATLRERFATDAIPPGHDRPLAWHRYERIARAVRAEHGPT